MSSSSALTVSAAAIREGHKLGETSVLLFQTRDAVGALGKLRAANSLGQGGGVWLLSRPYFWAVCAVIPERVLILPPRRRSGTDYLGATRGEGAEGGGWRLQNLLRSVSWRLGQVSGGFPE